MNTQPSWLSRKEYPFRSRFFDINGYRMHYIDEGNGETLLFVHGTPSWSFDFRNQIKVLSNKFRCLAVDHIGFGLSDKPEQYNYSTRNHSLSLEKFVEDKNLNDITLIVHDFGGVIGLNFAIKNPEKIKRIVILNSWLWSAESEPEYKKMKKMLNLPLLPFLYRYLNFSASYILPASFVRKPTREIRKHYTSPFADRHQREGCLAFARSLLNDQAWFQSLWEKRHILQNKPLLLIWGMRDPVLKPSYLEKFQSGFPGAIVLKLHNSGHFPQEETAGEVIEAIQNFMDT